MSARDGRDDCAVDLDTVYADYDGAVALCDVSIRVRRSESVALVGPSGSGKSTLLGLMNLSIRPSSGVVSILGEPTGSPLARGETALRRRIATMHQDLHLVGSLRVIHNVNAGRLNRWPTWRALGSLVSPQRVDDAERILTSLGLQHATMRRTDELSGGERQRVALARLMAADPELVLADEPTASLDPTRSDEVLSALAGLADSRRAVVAAVHAFDAARRHFDRLIGVRQGRVLFDLRSGDVDDERRDHLYRLDEPVA